MQRPNDVLGRPIIEALELERDLASVHSTAEVFVAARRYILDLEAYVEFLKQQLESERRGVPTDL